jgi:hypothetical protein
MNGAARGALTQSSHLERRADLFRLALGGGKAASIETACAAYLQWPFAE